MKKVNKINIKIFTLALTIGSSLAVANERDLRFSGACAAGTRVTVAAVGDVLMHARLQRQAAASEDGFKTNWFEAIPFLQIADIAYANLEGPVAPGVSCSGKEFSTDVESPMGKNCNDSSKYIYTGYPKFNYHPSIIGDLQNSGVDIVSAANNHTLDRKLIGVDKTVESLREAGLPFSGIKDRAGTHTKWHAETWAKGKRIAWLSCAAMVNSQRRFKGWEKQILKCYSPDVASIVTDLAADYDAVIVTPHWGSEYTGKPSRKQKKYAKLWLEAGAIAVFGAHPHVVQPWEKYTTQDGRETLIAYSLGNFASNQGIRGKPRVFAARQASAIVYLGLTFSDRGAWINGVRYVPTYMKNRMTDHRRLYVSNLEASGKAESTLSHLSEYFGTERISRSVDDIKTNVECM